MKVWKTILKILLFISLLIIVSSISQRETNVDYKKENEILFNHAVKSDNRFLNLIIFTDSLMNQDSIKTIKIMGLEMAYKKSEDKRIYERNKMEWKNVKKELPKNKEHSFIRCIICSKGQVFSGMYNTRVKRFMTSDFVKIADVEYWMCFPRPPK